MSIIDKATTNLSNLLGRGPPGVGGPHNVSWGTSHDRSHGGEGPRGFPGGPGSGGLNHGTQRPGGSTGQGPPGLPGLPTPPGLPGMPGTPGTDRPGPAPGYGHGVDRPGGPGHPGQGADRPNGPGNPGYGVDRPTAPVHPGHGADRPNAPVHHGPGADRPNPAPGPGQLIRDLLAVPRQAPSQLPSHAQAPGTPGPAHPVPAQAGALPQPPGLSGQMMGATLAAGPSAAQSGAAGHPVMTASTQVPLAQQAPAQLAAAAGPRADVAAQAAQARADALPQDTGMAHLQRTSVAAPAPSANAPATSSAANPPGAATTGATTAANTAAAAAAAVVAGSTMASAPLAAAQAADVRSPGHPLAVNDRGAPARPDAAGYTGEGPQRRGLERSARTLPGGLSTLLTALGAQGHTGASGRDRAAAERELRESVMQWLFWLLAIIAYGCIAFAVVGLVPAGSLGGIERLVPEGRSGIGFVLAGLLAGAGAWWFARGLARGGRDPGDGD